MYQFLTMIFYSYYYYYCSR